MQQRKIADASVWMGYIKTDDPFHTVCKEFFEVIVPRKSIQIVIPLHLIFEINTKIRAKKRSGANRWLEPFSVQGPELYPIDLPFIEKCKDPNVWNILALPGVGSQDLIYAAIAYIEDIPLVTVDNDFRVLTKKIKLEVLGNSKTE